MIGGKGKDVEAAQGAMIKGLSFKGDGLDEFLQNICYGNLNLNDR